MAEKLTFDEYKDPHFRFTTARGEFDATPQNSRFYIHHFTQSGYDHLFVELSDTEETTSGLFLWRVAADDHWGDGAFDAIHGELRDAGYDTLFCDEVDDWDRRNYEDYMEQRIPKLSNQMIDEALREWS